MRMVVIRVVITTKFLPKVILKAGWIRVVLNKKITVQGPHFGMSAPTY